MKERKVYAAASLEDMTTEWMWDPYIPRGKITMLHGESGVGKTMFAIKLMAACTSKAKLERYGGQIKMGRCLYLTEEENLAAMIKPKLKDAGAGLEDIFIINDRIPITLADNSLKDIILKNQISLMIIDPISAYLESGFSEENMEDIFTIILKLARLAEETGCAVVLVEETGGLEDIQTTLWRKTFGSHIPSYLCLSWDDDLECEERYLYHEASFLSLEGDPIKYELTTRGIKCA